MDENLDKKTDNTYNKLTFMIKIKLKFIFLIALILSVFSSIFLFNDLSRK